MSINTSNSGLFERRLIVNPIISTCDNPVVSHKILKEFLVFHQDLYISTLVDIYYWGMTFV